MNTKFTNRREEIKKWRLSMGLTQFEAATFVDSSWRSWQNWERGICNMPDRKYELWKMNSNPQNKN